MKGNTMPNPQVTSIRLVLTLDNGEEIVYQSAPSAFDFDISIQYETPTPVKKSIDGVFPDRHAPCPRALTLRATWTEMPPREDRKP